MSSRSLAAAGLTVVAVASMSTVTGGAPAAAATAPTPAVSVVSRPAAAPAAPVVPGSAGSFAGLRLAAAVTTLSPVTISTSLSSAARSAYLGPYLSGMVVDRASGSVLWSHRAARTRMPASTQKVLTAFTVLQTVPGSDRIETRALSSRANPGNLYLRGGGDPTLTSSRLGVLARSVAARLKGQGRTNVALYVDDTAFPRPSLATGWKRSYISGREVQWVRGLTLAGYRGADGTMAAGSAFRAHLKANGIAVRTLARGAAPAGRTEVGVTRSPRIGSIVGTMLRVSDNDQAEYLLRYAALQDGRFPTWSAALAHQRSVLAKAGVPTGGYRVYDGSGLSRSNRMPVRTLTSVIGKLHADPSDRAVVFAPGAMPRAGQTGTLRTRYRIAATRCAAGRVIAKTGTLNDVVALAGVARGVDGRDRIFAFLENGRRETVAARNAVDALAAVTVGCRR